MSVLGIINHYEITVSKYVNSQCQCVTTKIGMKTKLTLNMYMLQISHGYLQMDDFRCRPTVVRCTVCYNIAFRSVSIEQFNCSTGRV